MLRLGSSSIVSSAGHVTEDPVATGLRTNIALVRERIARACERTGRDPSGVRLIGVSKTHSADIVLAAHHAGLTDFGENRVQEGANKIDVLAAQGVAPAWHLIGNLQRNKVGPVAARFAYIHSVDSERLAVAISDRAERPIQIFMEVNVSGEESKHGVNPAQAAELAGRIDVLSNIVLVGLMTVAPRAKDPEDVRPFFRQLRDLRDATGLRELSMGMSEDFEVAVEEGATFVRVGRAIFGERSGRI
jgi:pyridoxal phosphate enzyme (YggS family)